MLRLFSRILGVFRKREKKERAADAKPTALSGFVARLGGVLLPVLGLIWAQIKKRNPFRKRPRPLPIVRPYVDLRRPLRRIARLVFPIALGFFCLIYGFFFALTAPYLILPFCLPIMVLVLLSIWALPDAPHAPIKALEFCFMAVVVSRLIWPNYLALQLPGLPWITVLRLAGFPMAFLLLISLSTSRRFRSQTGEALSSVPGFPFVLLVITALQFLTVPLSAQPAGSLQLALLALIYMTSMVAIGAWLGRVPGRTSRYINLIALMAVPIFAITVLEAKVQYVLWSNNIPSFLKVNDPAVIRILSATTRGSTGAYRAKATFSTPLGLSEYMAILTPFFMHFAIKKYPLVIRVLSVIAIPLSFYCIRATDSRLGVMGFLVSILMYIACWALIRFRQNSRDLIGAAVVYGYPALFVFAVGAVLSVHRLRVMVLGSGATAASNLARQGQLAMGIPKILANPIGHGLGQAGLSLGYGPEDFITVDNYFLTVTLETGVLGLIFFLALFLLIVFYSMWYTLKYPKEAQEREVALLVPIAVSLSAFLVIKLVFSQSDSHMLLYAMAGLAAGLIFRLKRAGAAAEQQSAELQKMRATAPSSSMPSPRRPVRPAPPGARRLPVQ